MNDKLKSINQICIFSRLFLINHLRNKDRIREISE